MNPIERIAVGCGGAKRTAGGFLCRCPVHEDRTPSLSIGYGRHGNILVHCFAECDAISVIAALQARGLWPQPGIDRPSRSGPTRDIVKPDDDRIGIALRIWNTTRSAKKSLVQSYLARRGITVSIPASLRMHLGLRHPSGAIWPAMVALVTRAVNEEAVAIHRTFLAQDGLTKAPVEPAKLMLGPCAGGVVRLGGRGETLLIGEGIETGLSALQATGQRTWSALSTSGLRSLKLPDGERDIIILADADDAGEAAAKDAARRWVCEGRHVRIARPPQGMDFNDLLVGPAPASGVS